MNANRVFKSMPDKSGIKLPTVSFGDGVTEYELKLMEYLFNHLLWTWFDE